MNRQRKYSGNYMQFVSGKAEANPRFSNYTGDVSTVAPGNIRPTNRTMTVRIVNATNVSGTWVFGGYDIFGSQPYGTADSLGSSTGVTVSVLESSHAQVKRDSGASPIYFTGAKFRTTDVNQFTNNITINFVSSSGSTKSDQVQPTNFDSPANQQNLLLVAPPELFSFTLDGMTYLSGTVNAGVTFTVTLTIGARVNLGAVYENKSTVAVSTDTYPYGGVPTVLVSPNTNGVASSIPMMNRQK